MSEEPEDLKVSAEDTSMAKSMAGSYIVELGLLTPRQAVVVYVPVLVGILEHAIAYGRQAQLESMLAGEVEP